MSKLCSFDFTAPSSLIYHQINVLSCNVLHNVITNTTTDVLMFLLNTRTVLPTHDRLVCLGCTLHLFCHY